jgi:hypothetical protein
MTLSEVVAKRACRRCNGMMMRMRIRILLQGAPVNCRLSIKKIQIYLSETLQAESTDFSYSHCAFDINISLDVKICSILRLK